MFLTRVWIQFDEIGLVFKNGKFVKVIEDGKFWFFDLFNKIRVDVENQRSAWIVSNEIDQLALSDQLDGKAMFVDLKDNERALVWIDGRFVRVLGPGLYGFWTQFRKVEVEVIDANDLRLARKDLEVILKNGSATSYLNVTDIPEGKVGVLFVNGEFSETLPAGKQVFWKDVAKIKIVLIEEREQVMEISGQELMTQDKVTLRLNGQLTYRITDARKSVETVENAEQAIYREAQLVLRKELGSRTLEALLTGKDDLAKDAKVTLVQVAKNFGVEVLGLGIRDVILPGDMKELMNKVIEAQKASEANVIKRREETAAMRSQMNTAKLIENNPTLMRLRELEVLETVAKTSNLQVVLGEKGLTERLTKLI